MRIASFALAILAVAAFAGTASAFVHVVGTRLTTACYENARDRRATPHAVNQCDEALMQPLSQQDRAGTYVNRGILLMARGSLDQAMADFDAAIELQPGLAEGYLNRGAVLVVRNDQRGAIEALDRALALTPNEPARAYYNRAIAYEDLGEVRAAYRDYRRAAELAPEWDAPRTELTRFRVG
jgi:tetratricopeptide (TPR) repeat protein